MFEQTPHFVHNISNMYLVKKKTRNAENGEKMGKNKKKS